MQELIDSAALADDTDALTERLVTDGYIFLRGFIPTDVVVSVREQIGAVLRDSEWLASGSDPADLIAGPRAVEEGSPGFFGGYTGIQATQDFHELGSRPELLDLTARLLGEPTFSHPLHICRIGPPSPGASPTPTHQDYRLIQGSADTLTTWLPLGEAPPEIGGLKVLAGSHRLGVLPVHPAEGPGMLQADADEADAEWRTTTFAPGDVLLFTSLTVHGALPNLTDRLRVSADFRFQAVSDPMAVNPHGTGKPHYHPDVPDFGTLTRGWSSTDCIQIPAGVPFVERFDPWLDEVPFGPSRFGLTAAPRS